MHMNALCTNNGNFIPNATLKMRIKASKCIIPECNLHECVKMHKYAIPCSM